LFDKKDLPPLYTANIYNIEQRIEELINNKTLRELVGKKSKEYVEKHHSTSSLIDKVIGIYNSL
jgi:glycosyltransferase involved in cell wall biosynthesis